MIALIVTALLTAGDVQPPAFYAANEELRAYLMEAAKNSPALHARHAEWLAALERIPQAQSLEDPMFSFGYFLRSETNTYRMMLAQKFPWFGTLRLRSEKAAREADAALAKFYDERNRVFADVKNAYFEYAFLADSIRVTQSQLDVLGYMEDIVRSKYEFGAAMEDDLLRIGIEKTQVNDHNEGLLQFEPALVARLNEAMGVQTTVERPRPQPMEIPPALPERDALLAAIEQANPDLERLQFLVEARAKQVELAKKNGFPDINVALEYGAMKRPDVNDPDKPYPATLNAATRLGRALASGAPLDPINTAIDLYALGTADEPISYPDKPENNFAISFQVNVPIWRKKVKAGIREAEHLENAANHEKRRRTLELHEAAQMAIFNVQDGQRRYTLFRIR